MNREQEIRGLYGFLWQLMVAIAAVACVAVAVVSGLVVLVSLPYLIIRVRNSAPAPDPALTYSNSYPEPA
jgi:hypothetical protein